MTATALLVGIGLASPGAGAAGGGPNPPGQPTNAFAVSYGRDPVLVAWADPTSNGGLPVQYFVVRTYNGYHVCTVPAAGPNTCNLGAVPPGRLEFPLVIKAVNAAGASPPTKIFHNQIVELGSSGSGSSGSDAALSAAVTSGSGQSTGGGDASGSGAGTQVAAELPFTGANLATLLIVGLVLLVVGWLLAHSAERRRWALRRLGWLTFGD